MRLFEIIKKYQNKDIKLPQRQTKTSAGYDLATAEDVSILPNEIKLIPTGLKVKMNPNEVLLVFPRSSLTIKKGLVLSNGVGVIDQDYYNNKNNEGHILLPLLNITSEKVFLKKGERVCQGIFINYLTLTNESKQTKERIGGFGSSK